MVNDARSPVSEASASLAVIVTTGRGSSRIAMVALADPFTGAPPVIVTTAVSVGSATPSTSGRSGRLIVLAPTGMDTDVGRAM